MKKKVLLFVALSCFLVAGMLFATPAAAYTSVNISIVDSKDQAPWIYGGDVYLINQTTNAIAGTGQLDVNGQATIAHGAGPLCAGLGGCTAPANGNIIEIVVDFDCQVSGATCGGPNGTPDTSGETTYNQNALPLAINRTIQTGTGPTAVTLSGFDADAGFNANYALAALFLVLGGASVFALRRRSAVQA